MSLHVTIESKLFPKVPPVKYKEKRVKYNIIIITRPSKMEVYHRGIRNIIMGTKLIQKSQLSLQ